MKTEHIEKVLSEIDESTVDRVSKERCARMKKRRRASDESKSPMFSKRMVVIAAAAVLLSCSLALIIPLSLRNTDPVDISSIPDLTDSKPAEGNTSTPNTKNTPQYISAFTEPELNEVYSTEPFSEVLPRKLLSGCSFVKSYRGEYDPLANPDARTFLALIFQTGAEQSSTMEIKVSEYDGSMILADVQNKATYALSCLYGDNSTPAGQRLDNYSGLFKGKDVTMDIVKEMVYMCDEELCKAEISVLCGKYVVSYVYTGHEITAEEFYDMVISSNWFTGAYKTLAEKVIARYVTLSASDRSKIESEINEKEQYEFTFSYFDGPDGYAPDYSSTCYGKFSDCSVWFLAGQACVIDVKEVGGHKFIFSSSFSIRVEKDGELYDLKDAFENGLLTKDDIEEIYEIHKEFVAQYYNGEELYKDYE